MQFCISSWKN